MRARVRARVRVGVGVKPARAGQTWDSRGLARSGPCGHQPLQKPTRGALLYPLGSRGTPPLLGCRCQAAVPPEARLRRRSGADCTAFGLQPSPSPSPTTHLSPFTLTPIQARRRRPPRRLCHLVQGQDCHGGGRLKGGLVQGGGGGRQRRRAGVVFRLRKQRPRGTL